MAACCSYEKQMPKELLVFMFLGMINYRYCVIRNKKQLLEYNRFFYLMYLKSQASFIFGNITVLKMEAFP